MRWCRIKPYAASKHPQNRLHCLTTYLFRTQTINTASANAYAASRRCFASLIRPCHGRSMTLSRRLAMYCIARPSVTLPSSSHHPELETPDPHRPSQEIEHGGPAFPSAWPPPSASQSPSRTEYTIKRSPRPGIISACPLSASPCPSATPRSSSRPPCIGVPPTPSTVVPSIPASASSPSLLTSRTSHPAGSIAAVAADEQTDLSGKGRSAQLAPRQILCANSTPCARSQIGHIKEVWCLTHPNPRQARHCPLLSRSKPTSRQTSQRHQR